MGVNVETGFGQWLYWKYSMNKYFMRLSLSIEYFDGNAEIFSFKMQITIDSSIPEQYTSISNLPNVSQEKHFKNSWKTPGKVYECIHIENWLGNMQKQNKRRPRFCGAKYMIET